MKFDWCEYIKLAEEMANLAASTSTGSDSTDDTKSGKIEARLRSSISRAYYAAYCIARNYLRDVLNDPILTRGKTEEINEHKYVADEFTKIRDKKIAEIGRDLSKLRTYRNQSDYDDVIFNNNFKKIENEAKFCLRLAKNIIDKLNQLKN